MTESSARIRNRRGEGSRLREEILRVGAELLDETGSEQAVTLRAVARGVGIAAPSIYAHFPDRESILLAVIQQAFSELRDHLRAAREETTDPVEQLRAVAAAYLDFAQDRPRRYRVMFGGVWSITDALDVSAVTEADAAALGQDALTVFVDAVRACADAGRSTSTDPVADAVALWVALHGLAHQRAVIPKFPWPDDIGDRLVTRLAGLLDRSQP